MPHVCSSACPHKQKMAKSAKDLATSAHALGDSENDPEILYSAFSRAYERFTTELQAYRLHRNESGDLDAPNSNVSNLLAGHDHS
jgi:hypothetical protein